MNDIDSIAITIPRNIIRSLIDVLLENEMKAIEWSVKLANALDEAQGYAGDNGKAEVVITITGEPL